MRVTQSSPYPATPHRIGRHEGPASLCWYAHHYMLPGGWGPVVRGGAAGSGRRLSKDDAKLADASSQLRPSRRRSSEAMGAAAPPSCALGTMVVVDKSGTL